MKTNTTSLCLVACLLSITCMMPGAVFAISQSGQLFADHIPSVPLSVDLSSLPLFNSFTSISNRDNVININHTPSHGIHSNQAILLAQNNASSETDVGSKKPSEVDVIEEIGRESSILRQELIKTKSILKLKQAQIASDALSTGTVELFHHYLVGDKFVMQSASFSLDGYQIYKEINIHGMKKTEAPYKIYQQNLSPGAHTVILQMVFDKPGSGFFAKPLTFKIVSKYTFKVVESEHLQITSIASEEVGSSGKKQVNIQFDSKKQ